MKVHLLTVLDMETGEILRDVVYEYAGPVALCDRALAAQAKQAANVAGGTAGEYGAAAGGIAGQVVPLEERWLTTPPGYGPAALSNMIGRAQQATGATRGAATEEAKLRAMRTGNIAGVSGQEGAIAGATARAQGTAVSDILARNAQLQEQQRLSAMKGLEGIYGTDVRAQLEGERIVPEDIRAAAEAQKVGWLQNLEGVVGTGARAFRDIMAGMRGAPPSDQAA